MFLAKEILLKIQNLHYFFCVIVCKYQELYSDLVQKSSAKRIMSDVKARVAVYQDTSKRGDQAFAISVVTEAVLQASLQKYDIVLFPELFTSSYDAGIDTLRATAFSRRGPVMDAFRSMAVSHAIAIAIGYPEIDDNNVLLYNSCCLIDSTGAIVLNYRKTHLYDPDVLYEKILFSRGDELPVADLYIPSTSSTIRVGILICFDIEFPEPARIIALKGASLILIATAACENEHITPVVTLRSRAADNHVFIMCANYTGPCRCFEGSKSSFHGQSGVFAPDGSVLTQAGKNDAGLFGTELNGSLYRRHAAINRYLHERRPDIYGDLVL